MCTDKHFSLLDHCIRGPLFRPSARMRTIGLEVCAVFLCFENCRGFSNKHESWLVIPVLFEEGIVQAMPSLFLPCSGYNLADGNDLALFDAMSCWRFLFLCNFTPIRFQWGSFYQDWNFLIFFNCAAPF